MPILKQLASGSSGSNRRSYADLTVEMISAPLADFRHTMHIGRGGDAFGDTSFLSIPHQSSGQVQKNGFLPLRFRGSKRSQSERNSSAMSYMLPANNAVSLPHVREDQDVKLCLPQSASLNFTEMKRKPVVVSGWSLEGEEQCLREPSPMFTPPSSGGMKHAESMLSFHIDLGPSMLRDVLGVMDRTERDRQDLTDTPRQGRKDPCPIKSPTYSVNINDKDFLFMDEDEDEIRV
ncbi:cdc42 effector protein 5-like [Hemibagrus wyckioides]|uniref:cdc42 effector protein 5-like n=1 Tax=Hemibagrus wyckioides TaxID=337641 RepID=UPI00266DB814|nr:cdc42 effector protein 5-like [Hemibagrus wyckioides]